MLSHTRFFLFLSRTSSWWKVLIAASVLVFSPSAAPAQPVTYFVDIATGVDAPGGGSMGAPWQTITYALSQVTGSSGSPVEIRVAQGTYAGSVAMEPYVDLFGGYENVGWTRDIGAHETVLDGGGAVNHVVVGATNARVDGFTIRGGNANGGFPNNRGGGVFADGTSPVIANNRIQGNTALEYGGGISCENCGA